MDKFFGTLLKSTGDNAQGFIHGLLTGLSPVVAERDKQTLEHQWLANDELAKQLDQMATSSLDPSHAAQWQAMSTAIRTTPYGKKPPAWATDIQGTMQQQIASLKGQSGNAGPGAGLPPLPPPPGQSSPNPQAQAQAQAQGMPPPPGSNLPLLPPDDALQPPPGQSPISAQPSATQAAPQATPSNAQAQQIGLGSQPGTAGSGFSNGAPPVIPGMIPSPYRTPESAAALEMAKTNNLNAAELDRAKNLSKFQHEQELDTIRALSGGAPITWSTTAAGHTVAKPDLGHPVPGIVMNAQGQPVRLIRYNDPVHNPDREIPVPNYGGKIQMQKADGTAGWFAQDKSGNVIGEITTPGAAAYAPPGYAPTVRNAKNESIKQVYNPATGQMEDQIVELHSSSETARKNPRAGASGGATSPTLTPPPGKLAPPPGQSTPTPRGGDGASASASASGRIHGSLGITPSQYKMNVENPLKDWAAKNISENNSSLGLIDRTLALLEAHKDDNSPAPEALNNVLYKAGIASDGSQLLNLINVGGITSAGRLLKTAGGVRAVSVFNEASKHTPGSLNSFKLMYEKLTSMKRTLQDINKFTAEEGKKYPGMTPPPGITNPKTIGDPLGVL